MLIYRNLMVCTRWLICMCFLFVLCSCESTVKESPCDHDFILGLRSMNDYYINDLQYTITSRTQEFDISPNILKELDSIQERLILAQRYREAVLSKIEDAQELGLSDECRSSYLKAMDSIHRSDFADSSIYERFRFNYSDMALNPCQAKIETLTLDRRYIEFQRFKVYELILNDISRHD